MPAETILLVPPTPDHPLLAAGRAGAMPPCMWRWGAQSPWHEGWWDPRDHRSPQPENALVVALDGEPIESACIAVARALAEALVRIPPDALTDIMHAHWWVELEVGDGDAWPVAVHVGLDGVTWRLPYEDPEPDMEREPDALLLARVATRLGCRVVILDGSAP